MGTIVSLLCKTADKHLKGVKFLIFFLVILCSVLLLFNNAYAGKLNWASSFLKRLLKESPHKIKKIARNIPSLKLSRVEKKKISKIFSGFKKLSPDIRKLSVKAFKIAETGKFGKKFIANVKFPADAIRQYSLYGKKYIDVLEKNSKTVAAAFPKLTRMSATEIASLSPKLKPFAKIPKSQWLKFKNFNEYINASVKMLNRTGKRGWEFLKWAAKNPKKTITAAMALWYLVDPEGCLASVKKISSSVSKGVGDVSSAVVEGVGEGVHESVQSYLQKTINSPHFFTGLITFIIVVLLILRPFRRLIFLPVKLGLARLDKVVDNAESKLLRHREDLGKSELVISSKVELEETFKSNKNDKKGRGLL